MLSAGWNRLFFLWGIFKRRIDGLTSEPSIVEKHSRPSLNIVPTPQDLRCSSVSGIFDLQAAVSAKNPGNILDRCSVSCSDTKLESVALGGSWYNNSSEVEDRICRVQGSPSSVQNSSFQLDAYDKLLTQQRSSFPASHSPSNAIQLPDILSAHSELRYQMPCLKSESDDAYQVS